MHFGLYKPLKDKLGTIRDAVNRSLIGNKSKLEAVSDIEIGIPKRLVTSEKKEQKSIQEILKVIRDLDLLVRQNAKESKLHSKLHELFNAIYLNDTVLKEVGVIKNNGSYGRVDELIMSRDKIENDIMYELKRSNIFRLISKRNKIRISKMLINAINQIKGYRNSIVKKLQSREIDLGRTKSRIIAGRSMNCSEDYNPIIEIEEKYDWLKIYSWDAKIAEIERVHT